MIEKYLPIEQSATDGGLKPKTVILTEKQIGLIEEVVGEFRRHGGFPHVSFSSFLRLALEYGMDEAIVRMKQFGGKY